MSKYLLRASMTAATLSLIGCANHNGFVRMPGIDNLSPNKVAILKGVYEYRNGSIANETIRIVEIDGVKVPSQFMVAEGAKAVALPPGEHDIKVLWVHASEAMDYYTYSTLRVDARPNCIYQFYSKLSVSKHDVYLESLASPATKEGNQNCGMGIIPHAERNA